MCISFCNNSTAEERSSTADATKLGRSALADSAPIEIALIGSLVSDGKSQVDEWMEIRERTYLDAPPESKILPMVAKKVAKAVMLIDKSRRLSMQTKAEKEAGAVAEAACKLGCPLAEVCIRKGMPKRFLTKFRSERWSPHQVGSLQSLGLVDDETMTNLTRSFPNPRASSSKLQERSRYWDKVKEDENSEAREALSPDSSLSSNCDAANDELEYEIMGDVGDAMRGRLAAKHKLLRNTGGRDVAATTPGSTKDRARSVSPSKESRHAVDDLNTPASNVFGFFPQVHWRSFRHANAAKVSSSPQHGDVLFSSPPKSPSRIPLGNNSFSMRGQPNALMKLVPHLSALDNLQDGCEQSEEKTVKDIKAEKKKRITLEAAKTPKSSLSSPGTVAEEKPYKWPTFVPPPLFASSSTRALLQELSGHKLALSALMVLKDPDHENAGEKNVVLCQIFENRLRVQKINGNAESSVGVVHDVPFRDLEVELVYDHAGKSNTIQVGYATRSESAESKANMHSTCFCLHSTDLAVVKLWHDTLLSNATQARKTEKEHDTLISNSTQARKTEKEHKKTNPST
jgi:hypothetical protein